MSTYEVTTKQIEPLRVAILRDTIESEAKIGRLFRELRTALATSGIEAAGPQLAIYFDADYTPRNIDVAAAVPVGPEATLAHDGRIRIDDLPGGLMVSLLREGPWDDFSPAYQAIMDWVKSSAYRISGPNREIHLQGPRSGVPPAEFQIEIQFPIQPR